MSIPPNDLVAARAQWKQTRRRSPPKNDLTQAQAQAEFIKWKLANQPNDLAEARLEYHEGREVGMRMRGDTDGRVEDSPVYEKAFLTSSVYNTRNYPIENATYYLKKGNANEYTEVTYKKLLPAPFGVHDTDPIFIVTDQDGKEILATELYQKIRGGGAKSRRKRDRKSNRKFKKSKRISKRKYSQKKR